MDCERNNNEQKVILLNVVKWNEKSAFYCLRLSSCYKILKLLREIQAPLSRHETNYVQ